MTSLNDKKLQRWYGLYGDFSPDVKKQLEKLLRCYVQDVQVKESCVQVIQTKASLNGKRFFRKYNGKEYEVVAQNGHFLYDGQPYKSLSAIAYKITGTKWNGKRFFGVLA